MDTAVTLAIQKICREAVRNLLQGATCSSHRLRRNFETKLILYPKKSMISQCPLF